ncbi:MAG: hypothetical protein WBG67_09880, partial [Thermoanaerobaculia bacterium]
MSTPITSGRPARTIALPPEHGMTRIARVVIVDGIDWPGVPGWCGASYSVEGSGSVGAGRGRL